MLIHFLPTKPPPSTESHLSRWLGLYLLLAFSGLYLLCVFWAQHTAGNKATVHVDGHFAVAATPAQPPPCPTATPIHHVYGRFGVVNTAPQPH